MRKSSFYNFCLKCTLFAFLGLLLSCNERSFRKTNSTIENPNEKFKAWLVDTISEIDKTYQYMVYSVNSDSLLLKILRKYDTSSSNKVQDSVIEAIYKTLNEYDEFPKGEFNISFDYEEFYYPSEISKFIYEKTYEIKNLIVKENNCIHEYLFNRGSLTCEITQCENQPKEKFIFLYKDNQVIKTKQ